MRRLQNKRKQNRKQISSLITSLFISIFKNERKFTDKDSLSLRSDHRLNLELDLQNLFVLLCTVVLFVLIS